MARYRMTPEGVHDTVAGSHIPEDTDNRHWRQYQDWVMDGNVADPIAIREPDSNEIKLGSTDKQMIRAIDWLLQELVRSGTIKLSDIPGPLKALYQTRKAQRGA